MKEILPQRKEMKTLKERGETSTVTLAGSQTSSEGQSSSSAGPSSLNLCSLTASGLTEAGLVAKALSLSQQSECYSEIGGPSSLIQDTQPPSMMQDSMPSLTLGQSLQGPNEAPVQGPRRPSVPSPSLQCRHTLSGKLGSSVPVAVRRALGDRTVGSASAEDLSSISSCHSNLDNIQLPTLLEELDMDCSLLASTEAVKMRTLCSEVTFHISAQPLSKLPSMQLTVASATHEKQTNKQTQQTCKQPLILQIEDTFQKMQPLW